MEEQNKKIFKSGSYVYIEGDEDVDEVYIVEKGKIEFLSEHKNVIRYKKYAGPGDIFGFVSALSNRPRMESAYMVTDSVVIILSRQKFLDLLHKNAEIAIKVINNVADELRVYDEMIFSLEARRNIYPIDITLFNLGKYYFSSGVNNIAYYILIKYLQLYPDSSLRKEAREMLDVIETRGIRQIYEPIKDGINRIYTDRQIIFCENEPGDELYIIKEGTVKIFKNFENSEIMLSILKKGDIFGELAIVSDKPRNATAISSGNTILIPIKRDALIKLVNKSPEILKRIFTAISKRVWFTYIRIESKLYEKPLTKIYSFIENKLLEENISLKSTVSCVLNFGIDELLKMTELNEQTIGDEINELLNDSNLGFNFGQIAIDSPSEVSAKAKFYRSRDHLTTLDYDKSKIEIPKKVSSELLSRKNGESNKPITLDKNNTIDDLDEVKDIDDINTDLFIEMSDEILDK